MGHVVFFYLDDGFGSQPDSISECAAPSELEITGSQVGKRLRDNVRNRNYSTLNSF